MAEDGDRHVLGDPITRLLQSPGQAPSLENDTPARNLSHEQLRRELANIDLIVREGPKRGAAPELIATAERRLAELRAEAARRRMA